MDSSRDFPSPRTAAVAAVLTGLVLGVSGRASDHLVPAVEWAFNLGAPWLIAAFALGALLAERRTAAAAAAAALAIGVVTYYAIFTLVEGLPPSYAIAVGTAWSLAGGLAGAAFGWAGAACRSRLSVRRVVAAGLLSGALMGEAILFFSLWDSPLARYILLAELMAGALLPLVLARGARARALGLGVGALVAALTVVAEATVLQVVRVAAGA